MNLRSSRRPSLVPWAAIGLTVGLLAAAVISAPRVAQVNPPDGASEAPAVPSISITFTQPMRADTVEQRFHLDPARPGVFRWSGRQVAFIPSHPWKEGEQVEVTLDAGALSWRGLPTFAPTRWSFRIGSGRLAYLWPANAAADLYLWSASSPPAEPLVESSDGILDFSLTADGSALVYAAASAQTTEIREVSLTGGEDRLLYRCPPGVLCRTPSLSTTGELLAYTQEESEGDGSTLRRVWVKALGGGDPYTVAPVDHSTSQPVWSARDWLVVYDHALRAYALYDQVTAEGAHQAFVLPNELGETTAWSPDGAYLVFPEIFFLPEPVRTSVGGPVPIEEPPKYYSHLKRVSTADGSQVDLSGDATYLVEDSGPTFSPDGSWIAFSRRSLDPSTWTLGRQLWLMRTDGSEQHSLTSRPALNHAGITWSPDGSRLAYMQFDQARPTDPAEIWWLWADGRAGDRIVIGGYAPEWVP